MRDNYRTFLGTRIKKGSIKIEGRTLKFVLDMREARSGSFKTNIHGLSRFIPNQKNTAPRLIHTFSKFDGPTERARNLSAFHAYAKNLVKTETSCCIQGYMVDRPVSGKRARMRFTCIS